MVFLGGKVDRIQDCGLNQEGPGKLIVVPVLPKALKVEPGIKRSNEITRCMEVVGLHRRVLVGRVHQHVQLVSVEEFNVQGIGLP